MKSQEHLLQLLEKLRLEGGDRRQEISMITYLAVADAYREIGRNYIAKGLERLAKNNTLYAPRSCSLSSLTTWFDESCYGKNKDNLETSLFRQLKGYIAQSEGEILWVDYSSFPAAMEALGKAAARS